MKLAAKISYESVDSRWVSQHWDLHLQGICYFNGEICEFKTIYPDFDDDKGDWSETIVMIYNLTLLEKIKWVIRQSLFEFCIGKHYSRKNGKWGERFKYRRPEWVYRILFRLYYKYLRFQ